MWPLGGLHWDVRPVTARPTARAAAEKPAPGQRTPAAADGAPTRLRPGLLEQEDDVDREGDREADGPAVEVALDERAAAERSLAGADAEGAGEAGVLARV